MALVAGDILPDNAVAEITLHGLAFTPDAAYQSLLKTAGATPKVLAALNKAKVVATRNDTPADSFDLLKRLAQAGTLIRSGKTEEAVQELSGAGSSDSAPAEIAFVVGLALIQDQRFDDAGQVYSEILHMDPDFPEVYSRLSMTSLETGDPEEALRQARAAIERLPNNATAHLNAGLALKAMRNFDGAKSELQIALRCSPDYVRAYEHLGLLLSDMGAYDEAIAQYKKAVTLEPGDALAHYNMGVAYGDKNDEVAAIREYRIAKRLAPNRLDVRQNLGSALMHVDPAAAVTELQELAALAPDYPVCHLCLGSAFYNIGRFEEAASEVRLAVELDPANPRPHVSLGHCFEALKKYDEALAEYQKALEIDGNSAEAHAEVGRVLLGKKDFRGATSEFKRATELDPAGWQNYDSLGQALDASGSREAAIRSYKQAVSLAPKEIQPRLDLALAQEKSADWVEALGNYHRAALDEPPLKPSGLAQRFFDAQTKYSNAQQRFHQHLSSLRAGGNGPEASALEAQVAAAESAPNPDDAYREAMLKSNQAIQEKRFNDAETSARQAFEIAQQIQPQDGRLPEALGQLGSSYAWRMDYKNAQETFKNQLAFAERIYGVDSPQIAPALENNAMLAMMQKDFATSEVIVKRLVSVNVKAYGEESSGAAESLRMLAQVYVSQQDYANSETALLRVMKIYETVYHSNDERMTVPFTSLCHLYDQWGKADKAEPCHARLVSMVETRFGVNSPYLLRDLTAEAQALRKLGRNDEAAKLEQRAQLIQAAQPGREQPY
jgi:tetratricopeptide (TPR) repeat protein